MRNLKRALSLTLASVMLLGMMVVGSSAAVGYPDVAEDDNVEAIEVVQSVGVMVGDENGNFRPGDSVSRAEMAVVMGKLLNLDYNYYEAVCPFTDVAGVYDWARGWVGAAAANGIVSGRGEGVYDPGTTVTAVEAASMLMRALGYFKYQSDYANGFEVSTVLQGNNIGIFDGVGSSASEPMTRNQVAQMVLNALQSAVVEPDGNTINLTTPDGVVYTGKVNYVSVTSAKAFARAIGRVQATSVGSQNDGYIVELGERLYDGKLKLNVNARDDFGRPSRRWEYDGKGIGTYAKTELIREEYTTEVTGKDLYDLLGSNTCRDYGMQPGARLLDKKIVPVRDDEKAFWNCDGDALLLYIQRVRTADGQPIFLENLFLPYDGYKSLMAADWNDTSAFAAIAAVRGRRVVDTSRRTIEIARASAEQAQVLNVPLGEPLLFLNCYFVDQDGDPLCIGRQYYVGSRYMFEM